MVVAEDPLPVGEGLLEQRDGPAQVPRRVVGVGEVVAGGQGLGVVVAEDPLPVGEGLLAQRDGPAQVPRRPVGAGEVVAGAQRVGVVVAEDPHAIGEGAVEVPGRAGGLALVAEEQPRLAEEVGGPLGVGVRWRVAGQGLDVREQQPPGRPSGRVLPIRDGVG